MRSRRTIVAVLGLAFGAVTLFAATRGVSTADLKLAFSRVDGWWVGAALAAYAAALPMRGFRWALLLNQISPESQTTALEATIVGFAANYLLPARLGELFRADYLKRISGLSRTAAIGSIGVERTVDGLTVLGLLALGLIWSGIGADFGHGAIRSMMLLGVLIFGGVAVFLSAARYSYSWLAAGEHRIFRYAAAFVEGVRGLNARSAWIVDHSS
jgi:uncharacterized membrane protein YbhN (UPF0104 family)